MGDLPGITEEQPLVVRLDQIRANLSQVVQVLMELQHGPQPEHQPGNLKQPPGLSLLSPTAGALSLAGECEKLSLAAREQAELIVRRIGRL